MKNWLPVHNVACVQKLDSRDDLCRVKSRQVLGQSLESQQQGIKSASFQVLHHVPV